MDYVPTISALTRRRVECVGPVFLNFWHVESATKSDLLLLQEVVESTVEPVSTSTDPEEENFLRQLDPKKWKEQDHYAVLGLKNFRHKATEDDIKKAYRMKLLRHHPDKRKSQGETVNLDDDYFTCITKAWEILGNKRCRRSYDSVDPQFDDSIPTINSISKTNFYEVFGNVFELNSRWSEKTPVPKLGNSSTSRDHVEKFYSFWYNFESWREYSYLDEEGKEQGRDREERKWIEKQNKIVRSQRKKEEMARIRTLVDAAYNFDPRIKKFKQEDKDKKLAVKQARKDATKARLEEEERILQAAEEEKRKQREIAEAEQKAKKLAIKVERDAQKRILRKERTSLRKLAKENNYYSNDPTEIVNHMTSLEKVCECFTVEELQSLVTDLVKDGRGVFLRAIKEVEDRIEEERLKLLQSPSRDCGDIRSSDVSDSKKSSSTWSHDELQMLIKAVNMFPMGTNRRWEAVTNFINQHALTMGSASRTPKEVLTKAKELQNCDYSKNAHKNAGNEKTEDNIEKDHDHKSDAEVNKSEMAVHSQDQEGLKASQWTATEQQLLEQALKTYPASTPERWDRIAECLPARTKKDCMRRYKELVEMVKAKKAAQVTMTTTSQKTKKVV